MGMLVAYFVISLAFVMPIVMYIEEKGKDSIFGFIENYKFSFILLCIFFPLSMIFLFLCYFLIWACGKFCKFVDKMNKKMRKSIDKKENIV